MYYPILTYRVTLNKVFCIFSALFFLSLSIIVNPNFAFADFKSKTAEEYRIKGIEEQGKGNFDEALKYFRKAVSISSDHRISDELKSLAEQFRSNAYQNQQKGNFKGALELYAKALEVNPNSAVILNDLGVLYEQLGIFDRSESYYLDALKAEADYLPPYMNLAYLYWGQGNIAQAVDYFEERYHRGHANDPWTQKAKKELFKIDPNYQKRVIDQELGRLHEELVEKAQEEFYQQIIRADGHHQKGMDYFNQEDYRNAIKEFNRALKLTPNNPKVIRAKENAFIKKLSVKIQGKSDEAIKMLNSGEKESAKEEFRKILSIISDESL